MINYQQGIFLIKVLYLYLYLYNFFFSIVANLSFCIRLDLCNSWDKETVKSSSIKTSEGHIDPKQVVFFYAIDCTNKPVKPVEIKPKPKAIKATYKIYSRNSKFLLASNNSENYPQSGPAICPCGNHLETLQSVSRFFG